MSQPVQEVASDRANLKRLRAFISYREGKDEQVTHLAQHFAGLDATGRKELAKSWVSQCGTKGNLKVWMSQTIWQERTSAAGDVSGWATPTQIAKLLDLDMATLPADVLESTLRAEIAENQPEAAQC